MGAGNCKSYSIKHNNGKCVAEPSKETRVDKPEFIEDVVCKENDINENEMKLLPLGNDGGKILLIKQKGELHAIGTKCTHYGALLNTGALGDGRVRCPWHGACFSIKTGDIEDYPGLDSLPCYKVTVSNGEVKVQAKKKDLADNKRVKGLVACGIDNQKTAIIVGGGPAGATCADTLRQEGFNGRIIMICKESVLPYDRVKVSKAMDFDIEKSLLRPQSYYDERKIETKLSTEAVALDANERVVKLNSGENVKYDYVFIATGSKARLPPAAGSNLKNIFVMRDHTDSVATFKQLSLEKHVVVLGLSFIAMEAAAYCVNKCASVTVIGRGHVPLKAVFGEEIGERVRKEYESKGIKFLFGANVDKFIGNEDGSLCRVELADGSVLAADVAIAGLGATLYTDWLKGSGIEMRDYGSVVVDKFLRTNVDNVYAGGDVAYAPVFAADDASAAIGHYPLAHYHGRIAALNICGKETQLRSVPFFWTMLFGKGYRYAGTSENGQTLPINDTIFAPGSSIVNPGNCSVQNDAASTIGKTFEAIPCQDFPTPRSRSIKVIFPRNLQQIMNADPSISSNSPISSSQNLQSFNPVQNEGLGLPISPIIESVSSITVSEASLQKENSQSVAIENNTLVSILPNSLFKSEPLLIGQAAKSVNTSHIPACVPPAFRSALYWPGQSSTSLKKQKKSKEKVPTVISSQQWQSYQIWKETKKIEKESMIEERKRQRADTADRKRTEAEEKRRKRIEIAAERTKKAEEEKEQKRILKVLARKKKEEAVTIAAQRRISKRMKKETEDDREENHPQKKRRRSTDLEKDVPLLDPNVAFSIKKEELQG